MINIISNNIIEQFIAAASSSGFTDNILKKMDNSSLVEKVYAILRYRNIDSRVTELKVYFNGQSEALIQQVNVFKEKEAAKMVLINQQVDEYKKQEHFDLLQKMPVYAMTNEVRGFQTCTVE